MTSSADSSFFQKYFNYVGETEAPTTYHRWCAISMVGAWLGLDFHFPFGHTKLYPKMYIMLMGEAAARKSTSINIARKTIKAVGYNAFAADRLSKEMFLYSMMHNGKEMAKEELGLADVDSELDLEMLLDSTPDAGVSPIYAVADEFLDLVGPGNGEFLTMLTKLFDEDEEYTHPKLSGADVKVSKPCVNVLAGNTQQGLAITMPPEMIGQGFSSRVIFVYAEPTGKKIHLPVAPCPEAKEELLEHMRQIKRICKGPATVSPETYNLLREVYEHYEPIDDHRFSGYNGRRYIHCIKLALILAAMDLSTEVQASHVVKANTLLHFAEVKMPSAFGEYGRGKNSAVQSDIMRILQKRAPEPIDVTSMWRYVSQDLTRQEELIQILMGMIASKKIRPERNMQTGLMGYTVNYTFKREWGSGVIDADLLTLEEIE